MKVLVAGGTGRLGTLLVERLAAQGVSVRVLTRSAKRAEPLRGLGVEVVQGDVRQPDTLPAAVEGVGLVVSAVHGFAGPGRVTPKSVDRDGNANLVGAVEENGAALVMVSIVGAAPDSPMELLREKYAAEQVVRSSGLSWTIVRSTAFLELWAELVGKGIVFGRGENPINFVAVADVADLVTKVVLEPAYRGRIVEIAGPRELTLNELADASREATGQPARVRHLPRALLRGLAPLHRQPRAALVMDTVDMRYAPGPDATTGRISPEEALAQLAGPARRG
jgi:uncharacterized protein YbjT (DUF2867 family)